MDLPSSDPSKQPVTLKVLLWTLVGVAYFVAALAVTYLYSRVLGLALVAPIVVFMIVSIYRIPREQMARIGAQIEKQEQSTFGRFMRIVKIVLWVLIGAAILAWLYERWQ
jgi:NhaP-type Na+/H+ or K+/H+ antiporter